MAKLSNPSRKDIILPAGHLIPREGELITTNDVIKGDNWLVLQGMVLAGQVLVEFDPEPDDAPEKAAAPEKVASDRAQIAERKTSS